MPLWWRCQLKNSPAPPTPTIEIPEPTISPAIEPPPGFKRYQDSVVGVSVFVPESWVVTEVDPGRLAILQAAPSSALTYARRPIRRQCLWSESSEILRRIRTHLDLLMLPNHSRTRPQRQAGPSVLVRTRELGHYTCQLKPLFQSRNME